jgi:hypothetical protein
MEYDLIIKDTIKHLSALKHTATQLLYDYDDIHHITADHHHGIQLKAQYIYMRHQLINYIHSEYNYTLHDVEKYVNDALNM